MQFKRFFRVWTFLFLGLAFLPLGYAQFNDDFTDPFDEQPTFLPIEEAFVFDFNQKGDTLFVTFDIADGYYLYKKQFIVSLKGVELGEPSYPKADQIEDEFFGISDVFYGKLTFSYPIISTTSDGVVALRYQGCATAGLCYPPNIQKIFLSDISENQASQPQSQGAIQFGLAQKLESNEGLLITLFGFLGLGVLLAFTPCVFPMYPILSGIVIGQGKGVSLRRAFWLSFTYVQGMAITYSIIGLIVATAGLRFQAALQDPILLAICTVLFLVLALAMFGLFELQLPSSWQEYFSKLSNKQKRGSLVGVFAMGVVSGLIASPCTTAPLTAILLYIAQSGDMFLGFIALYILSIGMGIPLIIFGVTGGKLLPKAGAWMTIIKVTFGFMMVAMALIFLERMWVSPYIMILYSLLGISACSYYFTMNSDTPTSFAKGVRNFVIFIGLFTSAMLGYHTVKSMEPHTESITVQTTENFTENDVGKAAKKPVEDIIEESDQEQVEINIQETVTSDGVARPEFILVKNLADFKTQLAQANAQGKTVMLDLYADWCVACKEFESRTFFKPEVIAALSDSIWMQIDLTDGTTANYAFQDEFNVLGLPTILFFNTKGKEVSQSRITGFMKAKPFAAHINAIF